MNLGTWRRISRRSIEVGQHCQSKSPAEWLFTSQLTIKQLGLDILDSQEVTPEKRHGSPVIRVRQDDTLASLALPSCGQHVAHSQPLGLGLDLLFQSFSLTLS